MKRDAPLVISASRRTDLVAWYPDHLADRLDSIGPGRIHTAVIWTKDPRNMLDHPRLSSTLRAQEQVFLHLSITGLGGSEMEPGVPPPDAVLPLLPRLVELCGSPERIRWRFDPIVTWDGPEGRETNLSRFPDLAPSIADCGIRHAITSICSVYPKVAMRFRDLSRFSPIVLSGPERMDARRTIQAEAGRLGIKLAWCCERGAEPARCIDGDLLSRLHPSGRPAPIDPATGQRALCGCTRSWDIGWYTQLCGGGCLYCYASPVKGKARGSQMNFRWG